MSRIVVLRTFALLVVDQKVPYQYEVKWKMAELVVEASSLVIYIRRVNFYKSSVIGYLYEWLQVVYYEYTTTPAR